MDKEAPDTDAVVQPHKKKRSSKKTGNKVLKFLQPLLQCDILPAFVVDVLNQEEKNRGALFALNEEDIEKFWEEVHQFVEERVKELLSEASENTEDILINVISLLQHTTLIHSPVKSSAFTHIVSIFNVTMDHRNITNQQLKSKMCELCEYACINELSVSGEFYLDTLNVLFDMTLSGQMDDTVKPLIKRMWEMRIAVSRINLRSQGCETILSRLSRTVVSPAYLTCKEGRNFLGFAFTLDTKLISKYHQAVKDFLPSCKRNQAAAYGEVYYSAWLNSSGEVRQLLEEQCIQNLMSHMFTFPRKGQELSHLGQNVFAILCCLHGHQSNIQFSKTLTKLYQPLLWRHLRSGNNIERCNAAEIFLDIYPLEKTAPGKVEESEFLIKQHNEMTDLLTDDCHYVRIIATRGVCRKLCSAWDSFPQETIQVLMRNLVALANDGSDPSVRRTLYESLGELLYNPESAKYLARILPSLGEHIHDVNSKVRLAFVKLLYKVKAMPDPAPIKYWKIVPLTHLAARLELENQDVGCALAKLLMSNFYTPEQGIDRFFTRLLKFIETNPKASRCLFRFSSKALDYKSAVRIMLAILLSLRADVKKKLAEKDQESPKVIVEEENVKVTRKKRRRSSKPLQPVIENEENIAGGVENNENSSAEVNAASEVSESQSKETETACVDPDVSFALVDIVTLLWTLHNNRLSDPENVEDHDNLVAAACAGIPHFLKYFKVEEGIKQRKVRFAAKGGKPMLALKLLDFVFGTPLNSQRVLAKSYNAVHDLYIYLGRIKNLAELRMLTGMPLESPLLSDEFITKCLYRYTKMIVLLHRPEPQEPENSHTIVEPFDASEEFRTLIQWTTVVIRPMIPMRLEEELDLSVVLLNSILRTAANIVDLLYNSEETTFRIGELIQNLLSTDCSLWFLESSVILLKYIKDYAEAMYGPEDRRSIMRKMVPSLLSQALKTLSTPKHSKEQLATYIKNLSEVKLSMLEILQCLKRMFGAQSEVLMRTLNLFTDAMVATLHYDVKQLKLLDTVEKVQELPFVCGMLLTIMFHPSIVDQWLASIPLHILEFLAQDGEILTATVSLLYTMAYSLPQQKEALGAAVKAAYMAVTAYSHPSIHTNPDDSDVEEQIDVKKLATPVLMDVALYLNTSLQ